MRQALESRDMNEHAGKAPTTTFEKMIGTSSDRSILST